MHQISVSEISKIVSGEILGSADINIKRIIIDSRKAQNGDLFIPLRGENFDGHQFINNAFANGATAAFSAHHVDCVPDNCAVIVVDNPLLALQQMGKHRLTEVNPTVVAVTGSTGKTSTKEMLATVISQSFKTFKTKGNLNSEQGLPLSLFSMASNDQVAVVEMGMRGRGQITELTEIAQPDIAVITNIGTVHLELLGTQENLALAKGEILEGLKESGYAVLNGDDKWCCWLGESFRGKIIYYGLQANNDYQAFDLTVDEMGCYGYSLKTDEGVLHIKLPIAGNHQVYNSLASIAVARTLGMKWSNIVTGISSYTTIGGRQQVKKCNGVQIIDDTYNANPDSMRAGLELLKLHPCNGKRIAILGDMRELGPDGESMHYIIGSKIRSYKVDVLICNGELAAYFGKGALDTISEEIKVFYAKSNSEALKYFKQVVKEGDVALVKGSRSLAMEQIVDGYCKGY